MIYLSSDFSTTLFADDTYLSLSNSNLKTLERNTNIELTKIDKWFCENKLSINYNKTFFLLFNKQIQKPLSENFHLVHDQTSLQRHQAVKYLGIIIDDKLNWHCQVKNLSLQLARYSGVFYRLSNLVPIHILKLLYHSLISSKLQYGILSWGTAKNKYLQEIKVRQNNIIRSIIRSSKCSPVTKLYKDLNFLKLEDIYKLELAKVMHKVHNNRIPKLISSSFTPLTVVHEHNTHQKLCDRFFLDRVHKEIGKNQLRYRGYQAWKTIPVKLKDLNENRFKKQLKIELIRCY